jgi:hypothetical protein
VIPDPRLVDLDYLAHRPRLWLLIHPRLLSAILKGAASPGNVRKILYVIIEDLMPWRYPQPSSLAAYGRSVALTASGREMPIGHGSDTNRAVGRSGASRAVKALILIVDLVAGVGFEPTTFRL